MKKKLKKLKFTKILQEVRIDAILPFKEKPSKTNIEKKDNIAPSDLFSIFTADIIKEDVEFVR